MFTRVAIGRARVVREVRAAGPLMVALKAPVTARGPWLTAVLNDGAAHRFTGRPVAVVVEAHRQGRPDAAAFLHLRRRGPATVVTMLGSSPTPPGGPSARLLARDEELAALLAAGIADLLHSLRRPRQLRLAGLPLGDPTARALAARMPDGVLATARTHRLVDDLDAVGPVTRSCDPRELDHWLPALLAREADPRARDFLRATARLHAAIGQLELALVDDERRAPGRAAHAGRRRRPAALVGVRGRRSAAHRARVARGEPHRPGPGLAAGAEAQEPERSTLTPGSSTVATLCCPSSSRPSAGCQPRTDRPSTGAAVITSS